MPLENRQYRKKLTSHGMIYLAGQEFEITLSNISITGLLGELNADESIHDLPELFNTVKVSPGVDIYLPEMRLVGEAEIVRSDFISGKIYIALEFRKIEHNVDNPFYERQSYRKSLTATGLIVLNGESYNFSTVNVSVDGLLIRIAEHVDVSEGSIAAFDFKRLDLLGEVKVVWLEHSDDCTYIGLEYNYLEKTFVKGIPRFAPQKNSALAS